MKGQITMKKTLTLILALLSCVALLLALGACALTPEEITSEESSEATADTKDSCKALIDEFFQNTLESGNLVATTTFDGSTRVESVVGDASCVVDHETGTTFWGFKRGEEFIAACAYEDGCYYMTGENYYNAYYCYFMSTVRVIDYFTDEDGSFNCVVKTESKTSTVGGKEVTESTSDLTFDFVTEAGTIRITANAKDGLVQEFTYDMHDESENRTVTTKTTFAYGSAAVELPDISDWDDISYSIDPDYEVDPDYEDGDFVEISFDDLEFEESSDEN